MDKKPLRVGLDLDGVILYNPARIVRPLIVGVKQLIFKKRKSRFYIPKSPLEKWIWFLFHKSSIFVAPGMKDFVKLADQKKIELYIITGRYSFLKKDLDAWIKKMKIEKSIKGYFYNKHDQQPHLFKEQMINKLNLDVFVEDNWDIVKHLTKNTKTKIFWIYNIFDKNLHAPFKFATLKQAFEHLKKLD